jgi:ABC-type multidrug transport system fused ATPase/permease subunit
MSLLICEALKIGAYIASILFTLILTIRGEISIGMFGACIAGFKAVQDASKELLLRLGRLPELTGFAKDYFGYLDLEEHTVRGTKTIGSIETLTAEGIRFTYPNAGEPALKDVSLSIRKGEKVLILGENGSGKTTLTRLLLGMYPPSGGIIRYNGIPLDEIDKTSLYKKTAIVAQNFVQYKLTIRENIGISDIGRLSDDERLREALRLGGGGDILETADSNLDFRLGREFGGGELSGGQWQKLAISRSIFKDGEFFLLDEPTAALDPLIEWDILSGFMKITEGKTAVIISHRTGLCRLADTIIVMKAGRIVETGSHPVLLEQNGEYARLYNSQAIWYR